MYDILFYVIANIVGIITFVLFVILNTLLATRERKNKPTYHRRQENLYEMHKYVSYRSGGAYEIYKFYQIGNKWKYIKEKKKLEKIKFKAYFVTMMLIFIILVINVGVLEGMGTVLLLILMLKIMDGIQSIILIRKCKRYLNRIC